MRIDRYIAQPRVVDLESTDFTSALSELLKVCDISKERGLTKKGLLADLLAREKQMTTYLGNGVCLPHARVSMKRPYMIAIGRCPQGLVYDGQKEYREIRYVFLLLASENARSYLYGLASLARVFQDQAQMAKLDAAKSLPAFRQELKSVFGGDGNKPRRKHNRFNNLILKEAAKIAKGANCTSVLVFGDTFGGGVEIGKVFKGFKTVLIAHTTSDSITEHSDIDAVLPIRSYSNHRFSQLRSAVLIGLTRGTFGSHDRLCCVGGLPQSNQFDSITVVDVEREFRTMLMQKTDMLPASVKPEVIERVLAIATELAVEGREGHPVGCLFALGDSDKISEYTKPLILNPFYGYKDEDRNILNPFMDETVKELSSIDGAFIIRGDGVLVSAGSLIHAPDYTHNLPSGLGSRHAAAASISQAVDCLCIVVSGSTGQVTLFRRGEMLPLIEKALVRNS
ncbi:MAG: PTS sugar transporter subunit IIA [Opitutales bacterium]|jgi:diadenylate cyclase|nr:PTS sugar transporter subunit IIA [Opitutales bacterium]MDP4645414.1 PTS sugar transporter subunit IIA [Opitutales bacterium]MDP4883631.1 PTS sugar transporter subunit IIA [Opitutales bacterium]MDP5080206.1 PTS sugar transporter subunit IIA [Opitutales bacterium]